MSALQMVLLASSGLQVSVSPTSLTSSASTSIVTSGAVTVTVAGGSGSYAFLWSTTSQVGNKAVVINSPAAASTTCRTTTTTSGDSGECDVLCQVTDTVSGQTVLSAACHVLLQRT